MSARSEIEVLGRRAGLSGHEAALVADHIVAAVLREAADMVGSVLREQYAPSEFKAERLALGRAIAALHKAADTNGGAR